MFASRPHSLNLASIHSALSLVIGRAYMVGVGGEALHVVALVLGLRDGAEFGFPLPLDAGRSRGITVQRWFSIRMMRREAGNWRVLASRAGRLSAFISSVRVDG
jgi:hypothetical protein